MTSASTKRRKPSTRELQLRLYAAKDAEIQRLRSAMVHAMDDCELALHSNALRGVALTSVKDAHSLLKAALEKK